MSFIEEMIDIDVPVSSAYGQWTQFESFPLFMEGVERVERQDESHLHWIADVGGTRRQWDAEIVDDQPDRRIAWKSVDRGGPDGIVGFEELGHGRTRLTVRMEYEPDGAKETVGSLVGLDARRVRGDLEAFKELVEGRRNVGA